MPRVRSRSAARLRTGLDLPLADELAARLDPAAHPATVAAIALAEAERPNSLVDLMVRRALHLAPFSDRSTTLARLARARDLRARTPIGGNPGRRTAPMTPPYLEETDDDD
jgi:hypothetical protein